MPPLYLALTIFAIVYVWLASERTPRPVVVACGVLALLLTRLITLANLVHLIDWHTILILFGTFALVEFLSEFNMFDTLAFALARRLGFRPAALFLALPILAGSLSMMINNITVMVFMTSLTVRLCRWVELDPVPVILSEVCLSNMMGATTLVGAPPNLVMASALGFGFGQVFRHMAPIMGFATALFVAMMYGRLRKSLSDDRAGKVPPAGRLPGIGWHGDWRKLAFFGRIDFQTLLFFMGLFVLTGALEKVGLFQILAQAAASVPSSLWMILGVLWASAIVSALVDNIPMAMAMAFFIKNLAALSPSFPAGLLVWASLAGLSLGGNMTPIGASPNVVAYGVMEKLHIKVGWKRWAQFTVPPTVTALGIASTLIWIKYRFGWY